MKHLILILFLLVVLLSPTQEALAKKAKCERIPTFIHLIDYLMPELNGQFTSLEVAYSDYLEDLAHWQTQYPNACLVKPEKITPALLRKAGRRNIS